MYMYQEAPCKTSYRARLLVRVGLCERQTFRPCKQLHDRPLVQAKVEVTEHEEE